MGIVIQQSVRNVGITGIGFLLGALNTLFLFTNFMDKQYYGLVSYLLSTSALLWPILAFGTFNTIIKFYSSYTDTVEQNRFMNLMLWLPLVTAFIIGSISILFYKEVVTYFDGENDIVKPYIFTIYILAVSQTYFEIFFSWARVKLKSVFGTVLKEIFIRAGKTLLLVFYYLKIITIAEFIYLLLGIYLLRLLIMAVYAFRKHNFSLESKIPKNTSSILKYSFLILIAGSVASLLLDLDKTMIEYYLPLAFVAQYAICGYIANVITFPARGMHQILYPLTSKVMNEGNFTELRVLYKKSALNLTLICGLLFVLIFTNVEQLFLLIPDTYQLYLDIILILCLAKLSDAMVGNNNAIIYSSDYYRYVLLLGIATVIIAIASNYYLIPLKGLAGAAIATGIAIGLYNVSKLSVVYFKFRMHPFTLKSIYSIVIISFCTIIFYFWTFPFHPLLNIVIKSLLICITYAILLYVTSISPDIKEMMQKVLKRKSL
ncbi:lipopolysaccharide biosynthesis protein [Aquimarina sp. ERC-38]|uniref:lipopolysaccharide biosynthesis protein n=1 Tax=Aquimarina sp. ERC-38 TaxID=2949996 RepID=UPI002247B022|nr:lipopolysaccharide biosynthesis protein [Aquimarina sp. ERC-38]UZO79633.1 lipopolysaccharide biosynthesis protein [Aquimarina sp. ERC-38]